MTWPLSELLNSFFAGTVLQCKVKLEAMALPKKGSRIIQIDGIRYRWIVGPNDGYNVFVAQKDGVEARIIEVYFKTDIDSYWTNFPNVDHLNLKIIPPKSAEMIIRQAVQLGWDPEKKGSPIKFDLVDNQLVKRKSNS